MHHEKQIHDFEPKFITFAPALCAYAGLILLSALSLLSCSRGYSFTKAVYDGVQTRNQLQTPPTERAGRPEPPPYQQYDAERKRPQ